MKKALVGFLAAGMIFGSVVFGNAQMTRMSGLASPVYHRIAVESDDSTTTVATYASTIATAKAAGDEPTTLFSRENDIYTVFNCSGFTHLKVFCDTFNSATPSIAVTPYYYISSGAKFFPGTSTTVTGDKVYSLVVDQAEYVFMFCDVTTGGIDIMLQGVSERTY